MAEYYNMDERHNPKIIKIGRKVPKMGVDDEFKNGKPDDPRFIKTTDRKILKMNIEANNETPADFKEIFEFLKSDNPFAILVCHMVAIFLKKRHDYSGEEGDDYKNFRAAEAMGVAPWKAVLLRMAEKLARVQNFARQGTLKVSDETVEDTFIDLANLSLIASVLQGENDEN